MCLPDEYDVDLEEIFKNAVKYVQVSNSIRDVRRKFDRIKVLDAIMRERLQCPTLPTYVECIRMYFESTPEPFIAKKEVEKLVLIFFKKQNVPDVQELAEEFSDDFVALFPETSSSEFYNPRTLKHLCRCKVRNILTTFGSLPDSVYTLTEGLHISRPIAEYILCESY